MIYEVIAPLTLNILTGETTYRYISKHKTRAAAERQVERLAKRDQKMDGRHSVPLHIHADFYEIREIK